MGTKSVDDESCLTVVVAEVMAAAAIRLKVVELTR